MRFWLALANRREEAALHEAYTHLSLTMDDDEVLSARDAANRAWREALTTGREAGYTDEVLADGCRVYATALVNVLELASEMGLTRPVLTLV